PILYLSRCLVMPACGPRTRPPHTARSRSSSRRRPGPPPRLPCLPTRRSSDLICPIDEPHAHLFRKVRSRPLLLFLPLEIDSEGRSEEHTSELQSREKLVCRLLLEKKKVEHVRQSTGRQRRTNPTVRPRGGARD